MKILDKSLKKLRGCKTMSLVKVLWDGLTLEKAIWEKEEDVQKDYP